MADEYPEQPVERPGEQPDPRLLDDQNTPVL
jgi:hypothetical protein